jgi:hypothetical protein
MGDPVSSARKAVLLNKFKGEESKTINGKSEEVIVPLKQSNVCGGKDYR